MIRRQLSCAERRSSNSVSCGAVAEPVVAMTIAECWVRLVTVGLRMLAAAKGVVVPADRGGKTKTLTQLISIGFLLGSTMARQDWAVWLPWRHWDTFADVVYSIGWSGLR